MRVLFFSDTHGSNRYHSELLNQSRLADIIVCAGDFTIFENDMRKVLELLNSMRKPVLVIHGNHETSPSIIRESHDLKYINFIHKSHYIFENFAFFGYGGGGFSKVEDRFENASRDFLKKLDGLKRDMKIILVTHAPPHHTALDDLGMPVGVINFRTFIEEHQPVFAVCGHIHENFGIEDTIGKSRLLNVGPKGRIIEF